MKNFSLEKWLKDKSRKVVTRRGNPVRIICTDRKRGGYNLPIVFLEETNDGEVLLSCKSNGTYDNYESKQTQYDLFFADEEPETIEVPFGAKDSEFIKDEYFIPEGYEARIEGNKVIIERIQREGGLTEFEKKLVEILKSEGAPIGNIEKFTDEDKEELHCYSKQLLDLARKELLKDMPKWEKSTLPIPDKEYPTGFNGKYFCYKGYCVDYKKLFETLPKEE